MSSYVPPKKNAAFVAYIALEDQANAGLFKTSPTIASGDFSVSIDGGALANLTTLPTNTPAGSAMVKISLSADEMNGDNITVVCKDAAGDEWYDLVLNIQTSARQVDDLAFPATSGRSLTVAATGEASANVTLQAGVAVAAADAQGNVPVVLYGTQPAVTFGQVKIAANVSGQGALDVRNSNVNGHGLYADGGNFGLRTQGGNGGQGNFGTYYGQVNNGATGVLNHGSTAAVEGVDPAGIRAALGMAAADLDDQLDGIGSGLSAQEVRDAMKLAPSAGDPAAGSVDAHLDDILEDTGTTLPAAIAGVGAGSGTGYYSDTVDNGTSPLDGVRVQLYTAADRVGLAYEAYTNALGVFEMWPDPGTYYRWLDLAGYSFTQDVEVEVTEP